MLIRPSQISAPMVHFEPDGVFAPASVTGPIKASGPTPAAGQTAPASIDASAVARNFATTAAKTDGLTVRFDVIDAVGKTVGSTSAPFVSGSSGGAIRGDGGFAKATNATVTLATAKLWSVARPYLYTVVATLVNDGVDGDVVNVTVGIRSMKWNPDTGFYLNGDHTKLRGFCDHNDFGGVGMAASICLSIYIVFLEIGLLQSFVA